MVNEKFRSRVQAWGNFRRALYIKYVYILSSNHIHVTMIGAFEESPEHFPAFFEAVLRLCVQDSEEVNLRMKRYLLVFMINCFQSLENALIRSECMRYTPIWNSRWYAQSLWQLQDSNVSISVCLDWFHSQRGIV